MADQEEHDSAGVLALRVQKLSASVEELVFGGVEHPSFELKRSVTLTRAALGDRFDFIKLVQGLANSKTDVDCLIVVGADEKNRCFCNVENLSEFNPARLSDMLESIFTQNLA